MSNLPLDYNRFNNTTTNNNYSINDTKNLALSISPLIDHNENNSFYVKSDYNIKNYDKLLNMGNSNELLNNYYDNRLDNDVQKDQRKKYVKPNMDFVTRFYIASLSIVGLFIVYRMIQKTK